MPNKIIVAIHGIGDQVRCETIQLVARRFAAYCAVAEAIPLGRLNATLIPMKDDPPPIGLEVRKRLQGGLDVKLVPAAAAKPGVGAYLVQSPPYTGALGFAEVYWADVPRGLAKDGYNLEEAKRWAATLVERVRALDRKQHKSPQRTDADYDLAADVIGEMIETIGVLQVLLYLLDKVKLFSFDLDKILVDYLGDVQVVAEFDNYRKKIVNIFHCAMTTIHEGMIGEAKKAREKAEAETDPEAKKKSQEEAEAAEKAEIYIVAHSEGTVIAFLGILEAISRLAAEKQADGKAPSAWVGRLRGLMTIGSPLNKHVLLWPELFEKTTPPTASPLPQMIKWVNYYDLGDPIGFRLERTREWMDEKDWRRFFDFKEADDIGFTRYYFAGQAHLDYFQDKEVFGHFIENVVGLPGPPEQGALAAKPPAKRFRDPPGNLLAPQLIAPVLPYVLAAALLFLGVFLLYKAVVGYTLPFAEPAWDVVRNVLGIGVLLAGVTAAVRIPRLTKHVGWRWSGFALFVVGLLLFLLLLTRGAKFRLGSIFLIGKGWPPWDSLIAWLNGVAKPLAWLNVTGPTFGLLGLAVLTAILIYLVSWLRPRWGVYPLIIPGAAVVLVVAGVRMFDAGANEKFAEARTFLARNGLKENRLDEASADLIDRYVSDPNPSPGCTDPLADCKAFITFVADTSPGLLREDAYKDDVRPPKSANADGKRENASAAQTDAASVSRPLWPVIVAGALFLCLWWLAAHVFDLIVVWQHYIRSSAILDRLRDVRGCGPAAASGS